MSVAQALRYIKEILALARILPGICVVAVVGGRISFDLRSHHTRADGWDGTDDDERTEDGERMNNASSDNNRRRK